MSLLTDGRQRWDGGRGASAGGRRVASAAERGASAGGPRVASSGGRGASAGGRRVASAAERGASAGGRGTVRATAAVARNAARVADAPLPGAGGAGVVHARAVDVAALAALAAARPALWLVAGGLLLAAAVALGATLATGRLGPLARIDLAPVAATGLAVAARRLREAVTTLARTAHVALAGACRRAARVSRAAGADGRAAPRRAVRPARRACRSGARRRA